MYLPSMNDEELLRYASQNLNSLTSTDMERELIKRFDALLQSEDDYAPLVEIFNNHSFEVTDLQLLADALIVDSGNTAKLLAAIEKAGIDTPEELTKALDLAKDFERLALDNGEAINALNDLVLSTTN